MSLANQFKQAARSLIDRTTGAGIGLGLAAVLVLTFLLAVPPEHAETKGPGGGVQQGTGQTSAQTIDPEGYQTVFYKNGNLNIEAYLYKPQGNGPFPVVIYNHGSRLGSERKEVPFAYVGNMLMQNGYAVLVPERRGYGKSDGQTLSQELAGDTGAMFINRIKAEATDVAAGIEYLRTVPFADLHRVAIMGWSLGGLVSILAASDRNDFRAMIDQAGGSLAWKLSPALRSELPRAARLVKAPSLCMDAENDATTDAVRTVGQAIRDARIYEKTIIYPAFTPSSNPSNIAPGHLIFSAEGMPIWQNDVLVFLKAHMGEGSARSPR